MKAKALPTTLLFLFAVLLAARGKTFNQWRAEFFTHAQLVDPGISGPDADPDGDHLGNFAECVLGSDPWDPATKPVLTPAFRLYPATSVFHFGATFQISWDTQGALLMPQVAETLGAR